MKPKMKKLEGLEEFADVGEIRNLKQMWEQTIVYHRDGDYDTEAMYKVYQKMSPKLTFQDIANVFSAVYADTYWDLTYMDSAILSKSMVQAMGLSRSLADQYASTAMDQWRGILCRKNIQDTGVIPVKSDYSGSLDIVCNGDTELMPEQLINEWNNTFWKQPTVGKNYVYTRCQNRLFDGDLAANKGENLKVQMFYTTGGFNQPPSSWVQCLTAKGGEQKGKVVTLDGKLESGDRGASEGFFFSPKSADHVCVIAVVETEFFKDNDPTQHSNGNWNSTTWITHNGAGAWHNVNPQMNVKDSLSFFNQDGCDEDFVIRALCRNVPKGSKICLKSENPGAQFDTGMIKIDNPSQMIEKRFTLPAHFAGDLTVHAEGPDGKMLPEMSALALSMDWVLSPKHQHYMDAVEKKGRAKELRNGTDIELNVGEYTITGSK